MLSHQSSFAGGSSNTIEAAYLTAGVDDLLTRGHGKVPLGPRIDAYDYWRGPRVGRWQPEASVQVLEEGIDGKAFRLGLLATYFASDRLTVDGYLYRRWSDDWLVWREGEVGARYARDHVDSGLNLNLIPADDHELRLKLQWIAIRAEQGRPYRARGDGRLVAVDGVAPDVSVNNFGLQLRYRWRFAPESDLYAVYSRGGYAFDEPDRRAIGDLFDDALALRDADQFMVKLRYRF